MPTVEETQQAPGELAAGLQTGVDTISSDQTLTFEPYVKLVLPMDGYVFWVKASLLKPSALYNALKYNTVPYNTAPSILTAPAPITVKGSLHYATDNRQVEESTQAINYMIFTSEAPINDLNAVGPTLMYIAKYRELRFAFNKRQSFYKQAGLWHYRGDAVYPVMATQVIDTLDGFDSQNVVVSNSLPIWLALNEFLPVYPSYLVDSNTPLPFAAVHIDPSSTDALQQFPVYNGSLSQWQLAQETVKISVWGFRNVNVLDYIKYLMEDSLAHPDVWGIMNMPVPRDEKITQSELNIIAQRKTFTMQVNYYQTRVRDIARQFILRAFITVTVPDLGAMVVSS